MKKQILYILFLLFWTKGFTQSLDLKKDTVVVYNTDKHKIETNHFFDNWFFGLGGGAQLFFGDHNKQMKFRERLTPVYELHVGKWFTPGIGVRGGVNGATIKGVTQNGSYTTGEIYDATKWLEKQQFDYFHIHTDVLFNLTNIIGGYKLNRFYNISTYIGLGWMETIDKPIEREISANFGLYNSFRVNKSLDVILDVRGSMVNDRFDGETGNRRQDGLLTASVGFKYSLKEREWNKIKVTTIDYDSQELKTIAERVNQLANDNNALRKQIEESHNKSVTDIVVEKRIIAAPILLTFPINKSDVSNEMRVNLGFLAKVIKEGNPDAKYRVTGYADAGTGSKITNQRLSEARAQAVYNVLIKEFNVQSSQIILSHEGGVENMYYDDPRMSRAVITISY
ncbi:OmpA family protein [Sphingobacterium hungaricum]|uniref:Cell envelope biogenesis protein OmpA n=1 Tax=Sphingobacterium hungaricum TaxID=2082723 RepID=A0A928UX06_9SPHI|nr:OmpA family protein [Sphingobacterium hungaricum]MBE8712659.1 cell envelope biogenesis protein OmpA [Sphingobacterium hungaricum]